MRGLRVPTVAVAVLVSLGLAFGGLAPRASAHPGLAGTSSGLVKEGFSRSGLMPHIPLWKHRTRSIREAMSERI
jgi:hypothetical protein